MSTIFTKKAKMKYLIKVYCILLILFTSCNYKTSGELKNGTIISNITIISANDNSIDNFTGYVVIDGENIIYAESEKPNISGDYKEIDGTNKFIISGLMDSHVHLANSAGFNGILKKKYPDLLNAYFDQLPRSYLYHGFTTLVDVNNYYPELVNRIQKSELHPDIYTCGNQVQIMNDFNMEMEEYSIEQRYQTSFLHDTYNTNIVFPDSINLAEHTTKKIVSQIKEQNGIGVKIAYEDEASGLAVTWAKPSVETLTDLVLEANNQGVPVLVHAPSLEGHQIALESGVNIFAHGLWNWTDNFEDEFNNLELTSEHKEVLNQIAQNQSGYQLTFRAITGEQDLITGDFDLDKNLVNVYPKKYLDVLKTEEGNWSRNKIFRRGAYLKTTNLRFYNAMRGNYTSDEEMWPELYVLYKTRLNIVANYLEEQNANFILGSDTPAMNMFTNPPGYNGFLEMNHMFDAGISLEKIFRATTFNNAKAFHLEPLYGGVEKGKKANLLILKSNPLKYINAYNDIEMVIIGGKLIPREELSATNKVNKKQ